MINVLSLPNYQTSIIVNGKAYLTLQDILPTTENQLDILFIAKTPAIKSVDKGHYFQGKHGRMFWNKLIKYTILIVRPGTFEDENLIENNFGLTDIVKVPRDYGNEPSKAEYKSGLQQIQATILQYRPKIIVFVYKRVLDSLLKYGFNTGIETQYGFNKTLEHILQSKVFVFPMPGTPCTTQEASVCMDELQMLMSQIRISNKCQVTFSSETDI